MKATVKARKVDEETGLPVLPPGQFWRVTYHYTGEVYGDGYRVELHEKTPTRWRPERTRIVSSRGLSYPADITKEAAIHEAAILLLDELDEFRAQRGFIGDYPPKRLEHP
jgi:hypothetical protein